MKTLLALILAVTASAQKYPPAFPREGAVKLFENDRVAVWHIVWITGVKQPIHQHSYDMAGVFLNFGPITVTSPEGVAKPSAEPFLVPRPYFQKALITHKEEALNPPGTPERQAVMVDLRERAPASPAPAAAASRDGAKNVLDNDRVTMWDYTWKSGATAALHDSSKDSIEVFVEGGSLRSKDASGQETTATFAAQDARFVPRGQIVSETGAGGAPRVIVIELK
jgi:hypothetical protein